MLPDASRLGTLSPERWRAFARRLEAIGLNNDAVLELTKPVDDVPHPLRAPLRRWHLERAGSHAADALRLLTYGDELTEPQAARALGSDLMRTLIDVGLLAHEGARVRSLFVLTFHGELYVIVDDVLRHGGDAVMGSGRTTVHLSRASVPTARVTRALDLGCGAAPTALILAQQADRVVASDINPRAIEVGRMNAAINGVSNLEFCVGDLFAPVAGERFDVIAAQPPFIARTDEEQAVSYLHGGSRGDELPLRVIAEAPKHLVDGGVCIQYLDWPELRDEPIEKRVRRAAGEDVDVMILRSPPTPIDVYAATYAYASHPLLDEDFDRAVVARREHLHRQGLYAISSTITALRRAPFGRKGWTSTIDVRSFDVVTPNRRRLDRLMAGRDLLVAGDEARLLAAKLQVPKRSVFVEQRSEPDPNADPTMVMRFSERALLPPVGINREAFLLMSIVDAEPTVAAAAQRLSREFEVPESAALGKLLPHVREALALGALEVA